MPDSLGRTALLVCVAVLVTLAWVVLWQTEASLHGFLHLDHGWTAMPTGTHALLFVGGWTVMSVAMMLPTSIPVLLTFQTIARGRTDRGILVALVICGYLAAWAAFGGLAYLGSVAVRWVATTSPAVRAAEWMGTPVLLLSAGLFQFSSLKYRCLDRCRSPLSFVLSHWQGRRDRWQALRLGIDNGAFCVGCCWALMLLMFAFGVGYVAWMLVLGTLMAIEKNVSWGRRLGAPLGCVLIVGAMVSVVLSYQALL